MPGVFISYRQARARCARRRMALSDIRTVDDAEGVPGLRAFIIRLPDGDLSLLAWGNETTERSLRRLDELRSAQTSPR